MVYLVIWILFIFWYNCTIIFPNCFNNISEKKLKKEYISDNSKLNLLYVKKDAYPKLKSIALMAILLFLMNLLFTIVWLLLSQIINNDLIVKYCEVVYIMGFIIVGTVPIITLNINRK